MSGLSFTHPDVLGPGVAEGWAEAETDPARIDWPARQARAAIPFDIVDNRPVNPCGPTSIRYGRNLMGLWGETLMADALVTVTCLGARYLLMVERRDGYGWAVPGGHVEPGETGTAAAVRELAEETGLAVSWESLVASATGLTISAEAMQPRYVPDPRASDEAWAVTIPVYVDLGTRDALPAVTGGDDAFRAAWIRAASYGGLVHCLRSRYGGTMFAAHKDLLRDFLRKKVTR